ncbi:MAG: hypothetical protein MJ003_06950 [Paludibacteraceae bacterium]|nr:hypothetical protein [Paludibacteraceae bacterium]
MENESVNKEMDLLDIIKICWNWFVKYIWNSVIFLFKFVICKWWVAIIAVILGFSVACLYGRLKPEYTAYLILKSDCVHSSDIINDFRAFAKTSPQYKSTAMNKPVELANHIVSIWPHAVCYYDTTKTGYAVDILDEMIFQRSCPVVPTYFGLEVLVDDDNVFEDIEEGVLYYLNSNEYYKEQLNRRKTALLSNMSLYPKIDAKIDSLANVYTVDVLSNNNGMGASVLMTSGPKSYVDEKIRVNEALVWAESELDSTPQVAYVVSHLKYKQLNKNDWRETYKHFVLYSIFICYLFALGVVYREKVISFFKE